MTSLKFYYKKSMHIKNNDFLCGKVKEGSNKSVSIVEPDDLHFGNRGRQQNSNGSRPKYQNSSRERDRSRSTDRSGGSHNNSRNNSPTPRWC